ncbi:MAG: ABC transporter substrate-binding protein [Sphaerochaetaceae bacterium]|nr:ABC transporter substrate-binding protein [Sphaerochaetaceae bacterium]
MKKFLIFAFVTVIATTCLFATGSAEKTDGKFTVGMCQLVQHPALDAATQGFKDALNEALGDRIAFDEQNASGEMNNCSTIINGFVSKNVDLIMANATAPLQAAASATSSIPVLGTSITHYAVALELDSWNGTVGTNVSGTSDLASLKEQAQILKEWFPDAKTVGLLYCSNEANSIFQIEEIEKYFAEMKIKTTRFSFTDTNDITSVTQKACDSCDVIYIPTDNTAASNAEAIANVVIASKTPVIAGEANLCAGCGLATLSINYYDLGFTTGKMAVKILTEGADVSEMPVEFAPAVKMYNADMCKIYGITPKAGYTAIQ